MIPPLLVRVYVQDEKTISLWLPLFLLWILLLPLVLILLPFVLLFVLIFTGPMRAVRSLALFYQMFCGLRGLDIDVQSPNSKVRVYIC